MMPLFDALTLFVGLLSFSLHPPDPASTAVVPAIATKGKGHSEADVNANPKENPASVMRNSTQLFQLFVEMQRRTEERMGVQHTRGEEGRIDGIYEADIALTTWQASQIVQDLSKRPKRKLAEPLAKRWALPIPYIFDGTHSQAEMYKIRQALAYWSELTCINFRENRSAEHKLMFTRGRGCWSYVGFTHQVNQTVSIGDGCQSNGTIAHEVGHAIGFWHEQSRPDRDDYILIHKHNVTAGKLYNFDKRTWGEIVTLNIPYDLGSDMHYGSKFYAKDANSSYTTVETRDPLMLRVIGQRQELSFFDVKLANKAYCEDVCKNSGVRQQEPCQRDGYQDPLDCRRCRCPDGFGGLYCESVETGVNAYCGGVLDARYNGTIYSPGYPAPGYHPGVQCSWLIKAPSGSRVYLQFVSDFGVAGHVDVCKDYVEVRYNSSLALTGARFCCSDPPRHAIGSETNEMLVLFRSFNDSRVCDDTKYPWKCKIVSKGFKAIFYMESCGGCGRYRSGHQPACSRRVAYVCAQSWQEKVKMDCPEWWYTGSCGVRHIHRVRYVTCHKDQPYCCDGFTLQARFCVASQVQAVKRDSHASNRKRIGNDKSTPYWRSPSPSPGYRVFSSTVAASVPLWLPWSEWSNCSRRCGGDIVRRIRRCARPGSCGKRNLHIDLRSCASKPCYTKCRITKKILCDLWTTCTRTVYELCKPYCHIGFALKDDRYCVASAG